MRIYQNFSIPGLSRVKWVFLKEINAFFGSNLPPAAMGMVAFLCGLVSALLTLAEGATYDAVTRVLFHMFYIILIAAALFLSMSFFVSEKKQGTLELLYTLPVSDVELVLGKFLMGAFCLFFASLIITLVYAVGIAEAPWRIAVAGFTGLFLVSLYACAVGLFASTLTESHLLSLLIGTAIVLAIDVGGFLSGLLTSPSKEILSHLHGLHQFIPFTRGRIPLRGTLFFLSFTIFFLFLAVRVLESRRWRNPN